MRERLLKIYAAWHSFDQETFAIHQVEARSCLFLRQTISNHRVEQKGTDSNSGRARPEHGYALIPQGQAGHIDCRKQRPDGYRRCALDIVIEGAEAIPVALEQPSGVIAGKILPLQQHMRPALHHRAHKGFDEFIV